MGESTSSGGNQGELGMKGTVRTYDARQGFGHVDPDDGSGALVVHRSAVEQAGLEVLVPGQRIEFEIASTQDEEDRQMTVEAKEAGRTCGRFAEDIWPL
jgi:cold shock CspA family protein